MSASEFSPSFLIILLALTRPLDEKTLQKVNKGECGRAPAQWVASGVETSGEGRRRAAEIYFSPICHKDNILIKLEI